MRPVPGVVRTHQSPVGPFRPLDQGFELVALRQVGGKGLRVQRYSQNALVRLAAAVLTDPLRCNPKRRKLFVRELDEGTQPVESSLQVVGGVLCRLVSQLVVDGSPCVLERGPDLDFETDVTE